MKRLTPGTADGGVCQVYLSWESGGIGARRLNSTAEAQQQQFCNILSSLRVHLQLLLVQVFLQETEQRG